VRSVASNAEACPATPNLRDIALETLPPLTLVGGETVSVLRWQSHSRCHVE